MITMPKWMFVVSLIAAAPSSSCSNDEASPQQLVNLEQEKLDIERQKLELQREQQRIDQQREQQRRQEEQQRQQQLLQAQVCGEKAALAQSILTDQRYLQDNYPATFNTYNRCVQKAYSQGDRDACIATAAVMAQWDDGDPKTSAMDFGTRHDRWRNAKSAYDSKMLSGDWRGCP